MRPLILLLLVLLLPPRLLPAAEPDFPLTADSKPNPALPKGELIKGTHTAEESSVFPGTVRDYTLYLPPGFDKAKPAPFMVFQDGVIYQAPTVFDNLIAKKEIPPLVGIFVKPGVVPAANDNALPRFNRSYEYDSITDTYARFLIDELLPAIEKTHGITLSADPNDAGISGNSSGGIAAFMAAWHRPDRFRRVFTGVGTYVGIHGGDQLSVLVRKFEPKPIKIFLQSGTGDNNLYCGDWWMANQMMERSLTWAGYDVNHAWGEGGHNQKHASQIFPDVLRWLWKGWPENKEVKANPRGESKWRGYDIFDSAAMWKQVPMPRGFHDVMIHMTSNKLGDVFVTSNITPGSADKLAKARRSLVKIDAAGHSSVFVDDITFALGLAFDHKGRLRVSVQGDPASEQVLVAFDDSGHHLGEPTSFDAFTDGAIEPQRLTFANDGTCIFTTRSGRLLHTLSAAGKLGSFPVEPSEYGSQPTSIALSPDQSLLYFTGGFFSEYVGCFQLNRGGDLTHAQRFCQLDRIGTKSNARVDGSGLCVDTTGRLYVATSLGIQVCDQAGRVNFIIPTPQQPYDICFGGKDLSELFIACGDKIYKRPTKVRGIVSGQMPPIKPPPPKL